MSLTMDETEDAIPLMSNYNNAEEGVMLKGEEPSSIADAARPSPIKRQRLFGRLWSKNSAVSSRANESSRNGADRRTADVSEDVESLHWTRGRPKSRKWRFWCTVILCLLVAFLLSLNLFYIITRQIYGDGDYQDTTFDNWGRPGSGTEGIAWYPTDFLRDVLPIPCHSHNDYWRPVPLLSALRAGCISVEPDVWLHDGDLLVGHDTAALQPNRTFTSLYIQPLVDLLERQNPSTELYNESRRGVFDTDPNQTLTLLIDVKTDGMATWPVVVRQLEPLRQRGWLSSVQEGNFIQAPVTVVGTGNTPFELIRESSASRDTFYDAPLDKLAGSEFNSSNSYFASTSFMDAIGTIIFGDLTSKQQAKIQSHLEEAHHRGLKARYWELPFWPIHTRNRIWDILVKQGVDILNVDNLKDATKLDWTNVWGI